jgi:hypothetical protein
MSNVRIVPIQQICMLCNDELPARDVAQGLAGRLCRACIRLISEQMLIREFDQRTKNVQVQ